LLGKNGNEQHFILEPVANMVMVKSPGVIILAEVVMPLEYTQVVAHIDLQHHKELDLVREYLIQSKDVDAPFTPYMTKKQKIQLSKLNSC